MEKIRVPSTGYFEKTLINHNVCIGLSSYKVCDLDKVFTLSFFIGALNMPQRCLKIKRVSWAKKPPKFALLLMPFGGKNHVRNIG